MKTIAEIRKELDLSQAELAELVGVRQGAIANYETGLRCPEVRIAKKICVVARQRGLNITLDDIYSQVA